MKLFMCENCARKETEELQKIKFEIMQDYIKKAKGDKKKAIELLFKDLEKL